MIATWYDAWREFSRAARASDEVLEGEPERIQFKTPEEIDTRCNEQLI